MGNMLATAALGCMWALVTTPPLHAASVAAPLRQGKVDWEAIGNTHLKELGEATAPELTALLDRHYTRLLIGQFDVRVPTAQVASPKVAAPIAAIAEALVGLQERLDELTTSNAKALARQREETAALRQYVAAWRKKPGAVPAPALAPRPNTCLLVLAPDRKAFVSLVGWLGLWQQKYREFWWNDATAQFIDLRLDDEGDAQIVALEYAAPDQGGDILRGFDMNTREKTGLLQHVLQRAAVSWTWHSFAADADRTFAVGLATALVVDVLGQNNARSGGSNKGHSTEGRNAFIPMAPPQGGAMEMVNADSAWRLSQGQDWFIRPLRQAQTAGEHEAKGNDKLGHFLLKDQKGERRHLIDGPFLGMAAMGREEVPPAFVDDYLEFHRAYRACFVHWLATNSGKSKTASLERFRALMGGFLERRAGQTFDAHCEAAYGLPLAAKDAATDTLERRFLAWLATHSR